MISLNSKKYISILNAVEYFQNNKDISITKCANLFNINRGTLSSKLLELDIHEDRRRKNCNQFYFSNIDNSEKAYWLGFILADGCIKSNEKQLSIRLSNKDLNHIDKFRKCIKSEHNIDTENTMLNGILYKISSIKINSKQIYEDLTKYGVEKRKSGNEKFCFNLDKSLISHYIRGIYDGDGWFSYNKNCCEVGFGMGQNVLNNIKFCLEKNAYLKPYDVKKYKSIYRYRITSKKEIKKFFDYIYKDAEIYLDRKYEKYKNCRLI